MAALAKASNSPIQSHKPLPAPEGSGSEHSELQTLVQEQQTALETMDHLFDALSEPNRAMQLEHAKMASAFQRFMEKAEKQLEAQSKQIADLQEQLHKEQAYSASLAETNQSLMQKIDQLGTKMCEGFEDQSKKSLAQDKAIQDVNVRIDGLQQRVNHHRHLDGYTHHTHYTTSPV